MSVNDVTSTAYSWLSAEELDHVRERVPMVYVEAVPVRVDHLGRVTHVGLLLRAMPDGSISRAVVSGRVLWGETIREALWRHITKDLGPDSDPQLPASPIPFTVAEYFPDPTRTGFHDPRQHAVSLAYLVPVDGDCAPAQDALEFTWVSVAEAVSPHVIGEMTGGHDRLVRLALAHAQRLP
jgi:ADP-ribose pyrophosphatase YjhB (NUDIX family)